MDLSNMFGKMKDLQAKLKEAQDNLVNVTATAESGGGMVKATVNGRKEVIKLDIDPELIKPEEQEMLQDLVVAAVNLALVEVEVLSKEELRKTTDGLLPNIPGLNLGL